MNRSDARNLAYNLSLGNGIETVSAITDSERMQDDCVRPDYCPTRQKKSVSETLHEYLNFKLVNLV